MFQLETDRLIISKFSETDASFVLEITNSPGWLKYIGDRNIHSIEDGEYYLENGPIASYETHGFGLYRVSLKNSNIPIGICGLKKRLELDHPDLGFAFLPEYHGFGYAYESSIAILSWARKTLAIKTILAITLAENHRSQSLLHKLGFKESFATVINEETLLTFERNL